MTTVIKVILLFSIFSLSAFAKVDPPNYDFSLNKFNLFMPGATLTEIEKKNKTKKLVRNNDEFSTYQFYIEHLRYRFIIMVQFKNKIVTDFHARLPAYFLHDVFHQTLINKIGKQDIYKKVEEQALYVWKNKKNLNHYYSGGCSITCFPIFYAVTRAKHTFGDEYKPILDQLQESEK